MTTNHSRKCIQGYALGCPIWANKEWIGSLFAKGTKPASFLEAYASVFNTVEGNTTFYALPSPETVSRWKEQTPDTFRFCLKLHRTITHDKRLQYAETETEHFFNLFALLGKRLGPFLIQLPPTFGIRELPSLEAYLDALPSDFEYAVEVRHKELFLQEHAEDHLNDILSSRGVDRVVFDARGVHSATSDDEFTTEAQTRKPNLPIRYETTGPRPFVRFISHPTLERNLDMWSHWAHVLAGWMNEGQTPYFFMHVPNNLHAPQFARTFHEMVYAIDPFVGDMPPWPGEQPPAGGEQISLFSLPT
jgi:uncharacterized protein YecE (DUF72 family)